MVEPKSVLVKGLAICVFLDKGESKICDVNMVRTILLVHD